MGLKKRNFWLKVNIIKGKNHFIFLIQWMSVRQKVTKLYFQSWLSTSKIDVFFYSLRNINFLLNTFFLTSIFEPLHFLKSCPMFNDLPFIVFTKCWPQILLFRNPKVQLQTSKYVSNGYLKVIKMLIPIRSRFCFSANSFPKRSILMLIRSSISRTA